MRLVFQFPASMTSVVDAPRLVSSDASPLLSHIFSATAASEGLGNPVARAS